MTSAKKIYALGGRVVPPVCRNAFFLSACPSIPRAVSDDDSDDEEEKQGRGRDETVYELVLALVG